MSVGIVIGILVGGFSIGYAFHLWGNMRDEKRLAKMDAERELLDWYVVKLRLPYMYTEAGHGVVTVEVKAKDKDQAWQDAKKILKGRSLTCCTRVAVNKLKSGG